MCEGSLTVWELWKIIFLMAKYFLVFNCANSFYRFNINLKQVLCNAQWSFSYWVYLGFKLNFPSQAFLSHPVRLVNIWCLLSAWEHTLPILHSRLLLVRKKLVMLPKSRLVFLILYWRKYHFKVNCWKIWQLDITHNLCVIWSKQ